MKVTCVVDDAVQLSSPFWGEHGVAFLIETETARVLFDTGQSGTVLMHNLGLLDVDHQMTSEGFLPIDAVAISHAHYDHTGGLSALMERVSPGTPLYANPDLFRERFSGKGDGVEYVGLSMSREELEAGLTLRLSAIPQEIVSGVWTTGEITDRSEPEGRSARHLMREGDMLVADAYRDDMALVLEEEGRLVLLCGCCHAGLLNTINHVQRAFGRPIWGIIGGLHLTGISLGHMQHVGEVLVETESVQRIYSNHCTGEGAYIHLMLKLGPDRICSCPAGTIIEF